MQNIKSFRANMVWDWTEESDPRPISEPPSGTSHITLNEILLIPVDYETVLLNVTGIARMNLDWGYERSKPTEGELLHSGYIVNPNGVGFLPKPYQITYESKREANSSQIERAITFAEHRLGCKFVET